MKRNGLSVWLSCFSILFLIGCFKPEYTKVPTYEEARTTVMREGPLIDATVEERYKLKCGDKPVAVTKAANVPYTGVLFTNDRAECLRAQVAERDRVRTDLEAERLKARTKEIIANAALQRIAEQSKRSWWDNYGGGVLFSTGAAIGMAIVIGVLYAVTGGKAVTVNSYVLPIN
jgi:hypothetical protein